MTTESIKMLSLKEVQARMRISGSSVNRMLKRKEPPFDCAVRAGRRVLIREDVFESWTLGKRANLGGQNG